MSGNALKKYITTNNIISGNGTGIVNLLAPSINSVLIGDGTAVPLFSQTPTVTSITAPIVNSGTSVTLRPTGNAVSLKNASAVVTPLEFYNSTGANFVALNGAQAK